MLKSFEAEQKYHVGETNPSFVEQKMNKIKYVDKPDKSDSFTFGLRSGKLKRTISHYFWKQCHYPQKICFKENTEE